MKRFPMSVDLKDKTVFLIGNGPQIRDKEEKLAPFGPVLLRRDSFGPWEIAQAPAMVIVGDTPPDQARQISALCCQHRIPVNVVDMPQLCSFYFPALITRGDLTVSVATGGSSPEAAAYLRRSMEQLIPENTDQILQWITQHRAWLRARGILKAAIGAAFEKNRPLTPEELEELAENTL